MSKFSQCWAAVVATTLLGACANHSGKQVSQTSDSRPAAENFVANSGLTSAVKAANLASINDFGRFTGLKSYAKGTSLNSILSDVFGMDESEFDPSAFKILAEGDGAAKTLATDLRDMAKESFSVEEGEGEVIKIFNQLSDEIEKVVLPATQFAKVQYFYHGISEDGDLLYRVLVIEEKDGSLTVLDYVHNPY